jgi:hypothetical protein
MSWMLDGEAYHEFEAEAERRTGPSQPFILDVWEQCVGEVYFAAIWNALG